MIEQVLQNVRKAEQAADEIKAAAEQKAEQRRLDADKESSATLANAKSVAKGKADKIKAAAIAEAEQNASRSREKCFGECKKLTEEKDALVSKLADEMLGRIKDGGC